MYIEMKAMRVAEIQATQRMQIVADFGSPGKRRQTAAHRLEPFQSAYAEHRVSWFSVNRNFRFDELVTGMGPGYSGLGIIQARQEGATGSSSLFRFETNVGSETLSRRHKSIAAS